jgi:hypothetical protein
MDFSNSWSWVIKTSYFSWAWVEYKDIKFKKNYEIESLNCLNIDNTISNSLNLNETGSIIFEKNILTLNWDCNSSSKKIETNLKYKNNYTKKLTINTVSWLIEVK